MIVLGIDPAIRTTGYGIIQVGNDLKPSVVDCGIIANSPKLPHSECVRRLYCGTEELINKYSPDVASMEAPFVGRNAGTAIILGMARGAILASLAVHQIPAFSYSPTVAKRAAAGCGGATKEQIAVLLAAELNVDINMIPLDCTDALALAICHAQRVLSAIPGQIGKSI